MSTGFYEILAVSPDADVATIRAAWQDQVGQVVRKLRAAEARQLDTATLVARREQLGEAWAVLGDPARRRRYDRFRDVSRAGIPSDADELWTAAGSSLVDPAAAAALDVIRALTDMRLGDDANSAPPLEAEVAAATVVEPEPDRVVAPAPVAREGAPRTTVQLALHPAADDAGRLLELYGPTGSFLRAARESRGVSLEDLVGVTRISLRFVDAMERDAFAELPGATFVRGYVRTVLRALDALPDGEPTEEFVEDWMSRFHRARG